MVPVKMQLHYPQDKFRHQAVTSSGRVSTDLILEQRGWFLRDWEKRKWSEKSTLLGGLITMFTHYILHERRTSTSVINEQAHNNI